MGRRSSSSRWLERQSRDRYVRARRTAGYRSRAAYKLIELDRRDRLLRPGACVIDLGAAPGGWTQVAVEKVGKRGTVVAVDVLSMEPVAGAAIVTGDCRTAGVREAVAAVLDGKQVDLVISDMAPNITGIGARDEAAACELAETALDFAHAFLRPGGSLLMKLFRFAATEELEAEIARKFAQVNRRKPDSSRAQSREFYVVAQGFGI